MTDTQEGWTTEEVDAAWVEEVDEGWAEWEGDYEYVRQGRSRLKLAVTFLFAILLVGLLVVGGLSLWVVRQVNPPGDPGAKLTVTIDPGATTSEIADLLETRGVITNAAVFRWYVSYKKAGPFSPGYYEMRKRSSMGDVVKVLETPPPITFTNVTFPEGLTLDRFAGATRGEGAAPDRREVHGCGPVGAAAIEVRTGRREQPRGSGSSRTPTRSPRTRMKPRSSPGSSPRWRRSPPRKASTTRRSSST